MEKLYEKLSIILEVDDLTSDSELSEFENWDSLGILSVLAMIDSTYGVTITSAEIASLKTVGDLVAILKEKVGV
jgi:acyl carrier protein